MVKFYQTKGSKCRVCKHNRVRSVCTDCGARASANNCIRGNCKDCGGASIRQDNVRRSTCKDCGTSRAHYRDANGFDTRREEERETEERGEERGGEEW